MHFLGGLWGELFQNLGKTLALFLFELLVVGCWVAVARCDNEKVWKISQLYIPVSNAGIAGRYIKPECCTAQLHLIGVSFDLVLTGANQTWGIPVFSRINGTPLAYLLCKQTSHEQSNL